jgi:hypothetical protein
MELKISSQKELFKQRIEGKELAKKRINQIDKLEDFSEACLLSGNNLSAQSYGKLLENVLKRSLNIDKQFDEVSGDGVCVNGKKVEIKISIQGASDQFNFVQIRPDHEVDAYIFSTYDIENESLFYYIDKNKMMEILGDFGSFAHGTVKVNGEIDRQSIIDNLGMNYEYAIRPNFVKKDPVWKEILKHSVSEEKLLELVS